MKISGEFQQAKVRANHVSEGQFPGEYFVQLSTVDGNVNAFFPSSSVDESSRTINVIIISKRDNDILVNLPTGTLSSGSRAWFSKELVTEV
jgi:hypothetical protein